MHTCLITNLHSLSMGSGGDWRTPEELKAFEERVNELMPFLTTLDLELSEY